jgi:anti-sigma factor ChrR (cupin superfamily)
MNRIAKHDKTEELSNVAAAYALGSLDASEAAEFERHLAECAACSVEVAQHGEILGRFVSSDGLTSPPALSRERFLRSVKLSAAKPAVGPNDPAVLLRRPGLLISRPANRTWESAGIAGIRSKPLFVDEERKYATVLVCMEAGVHYPSHRHRDVEELLLLQGDLQVEGEEMRPGDYCRAEPGSIHGESYTQHGCMFVLRSSQEDEVLA